jgi:outer membrane protein TolC
VAALAALAGCAVGPDYVAPDPELPDVWHMELSRGLEGGEGDLRRWWEALDDPVLETLIERASAGSLDLRVAYARVMEARAQRGVARGQWFPGLDAGGSYTKGYTTDNLAGLTPTGDRDFESANLGLDASWELDVFGRIRRSSESADASLLATVEDYRDVTVILYADVATTYVEVRSLRRVSLEIWTSARPSSIWPGPRRRSPSWRASSGRRSTP